MLTTAFGVSVCVCVQALPRALGKACCRGRRPLAHLSLHLSEDCRSYRRARTRMCTERRLWFTQPGALLSSPAAASGARGSSLRCDAFPAGPQFDSNNRDASNARTHARAHALSAGSPSPYTGPRNVSRKTLERGYTRLCCDYAAPKWGAGLYARISRASRSGETLRSL